MNNTYQTPDKLSNTFMDNIKKKDLRKLAFLITAFALLFISLILQRDAGMSGDEHFHFQQAEDVVNFYKTFGKDTTSLSDTRKEGTNFHQYGQLPDNISYLIANVFNIEDILSVRHFVNSIFGWLGILFVGLLAFRMSGSWMAAIITSILLFLSPRYLGHSFNNLKDVPFAAMMIMGVYYITYFFQTFPKPPKRVLVMIAVSVGLTLAIRVGGLLLIAFFGLYALLYLIKTWFELRKSQTSNGKKNLAKNEKFSYLFSRMLIFGVLTCIGGYIIGVFLWPYALVSPIKHVVATFSEMSNFSTAIRQLFEGSLQWSDALPWYYTPKYILMTIPVAVIIGFLIYPFIGGWKKDNRFNTFIVYFACIFPVFWIVFTNANVYGGWRHAMFAYPPMVVCAGLGFNALINLCKNRYLKIAATALPFLLLIMPLTHVIKNHPYEYVYFNELSGGMDNAYGNYEMDYYYHSTREATEWVIENAEKSGLETGDKIRVASWHAASVGYFLRNDTARFQNTFSRWLERGNNDWDYAIFVITGMMPEQIKGEHFPPKNSVHEITVDGKPICFVLKREDKSDFIGNNFKKANEKDSAIYYLEKSFAYDNYNETVIQNLIELYFMSGRMDDAKKMLDHGLAYLPKSETMNYFLAHYYMSSGNLDEAIKTAERILDINYKFSAGYNLLTNCYLRKNDAKSAERTLLRMIDVDQLDEQGMKQLMEIYKAQGLNEAMAAKRVYNAMAKSFEKRGKKEEAAIYRNYAKGIR